MKNTCVQRLFKMSECDIQLGLKDLVSHPKLFAYIL